MNQVAGMPCFLSSARMRAAPITPNSPRDTGVGVVIPRAIQPDIASKSKLMQTMCFAMRSIGPYAALPDQLSPLLHFALEVRGVLLRRIADRLRAFGGELRAHLGRAQDGDAFRVQLVDDPPGRARGSEQAVHAYRLESRKAGLRYGRHLGKGARAPGP